MTAAYRYRYRSIGNPAARPYVPVPSNLPTDEPQWVIVRTEQGSNILTAGICRRGSSSIRIDPATIPAGTVVNILAHGLGDSGSLYFINRGTIDGASQLNFDTAVGPAAEFTPTHVSGIVEINGQPAARTVRAFSYDSIEHSIGGFTVNLSRTLGDAVSDPDTGAYSIALERGYTDRVFVVAFDDYGEPFTPNLAVTIGYRIRPTTPNGYVYDVTSDGQLPSAEPAWPTDTGQTAQLGTATVRPVPFYRPLVHGPILPVTAAP